MGMSGKASQDRRVHCLACGRCVVSDSMYTGIVTRSTFHETITRFSRSFDYGFDVESFGKRYEDRLFSIQLADDCGGVYFNFLDTPDHNGFLPDQEFILPISYLQYFDTVFGNPGSLFYAQNGKFDVNKVVREGIHFVASLHCTWAIGRVVKNTHMRYGLDHQLKRIGRAKDDGVAQYIKQHKLHSKVKVHGKQKAEVVKHFDKVPLKILVPYGITDAVEVRVLGRWQREQLNKLDRAAPQAPSVWNVAKNEIALGTVCASMERRGILLDRSYAQRGLEHEQRELEATKKAIGEYVGTPYKSGPIWLAAAFDKFGQPYDRNPKTGNPIFDKHALAGMESPIADRVKRIRRHEKYLSTYYSSFLYHADSDDLIHASVNQGGTETGRFSYSDPNLQNIPKEDEGDFEFWVRACFKPRSGFCYTMIDFDQQEFRLMLDYAGERELIRQIMEEGLDVHQATANMLGVTRKQAKTLNFGLLYGMGVAKLAAALKVSVPVAKELKALYFSRLPRVLGFLRTVMDRGRERKYVWNWFGRRCFLPRGVDQDMSYVLPNHIIQGGGGDICKLAMVRIAPILAPTKSRMLVQVHDEILFEIHKDELDLVPVVRSVMEDVYVPKNGLKLTCGVDHSWESWGHCHRQKGEPR